MDTCLDDTRPVLRANDLARHRVTLASAQLASVREIYDAIPVALCIIDTDLRLVSLNRRMAEITGHDPEHSFGCALDKLTPGIAGELDPAVRRALAGEQVAEIEVRGTLIGTMCEGRDYLVSIVPLRSLDGTVAGALLAGIDITIRKRALAALAESEDHYRHTVELSPYLAWTAEPDGRIRDVARRCLEVTGVAQENLLGEGWARIVHPDDLDWVREHWAQTCRTGVPHDIEYRARHADGTYRWMRAVAAPRRDAEGQITRWYGVHTDVHDRRLAEDALQDSERTAREQAALLQAVYAAAPVGLAFHDCELRYVAVNDRLAEMTGHPVAEAIGRRPREFYRDQLAAERVEQAVQRVIDTGWPIEGVEFRAIISTTPGVERQFVTSFHPVRDAESRMLGVSVAVNEVTERKRAEAQIVHLAHHDPLTGLANRLLFRERLQEALTRIGDRQALALHYLDLDQFKCVNDALGHAVGDRLLMQAAERLRRCVRERDSVVRLGGDEFAVIQTDLPHPESAASLAERLIHTLSQPYQLGGEMAVVGASVGIALAPADGTTPDELTRHADTALYRAKAEGRGVYRFFRPSMDEAARLTQALRTSMRLAIARHEFELCYQPLIDLRGGKTTCFEALLRWRHPLHGLLDPDLFIPIAEDSGLIVPLGKQVLRMACREALSWPVPVRVAVNLSVIQFRSPGLVRTVANALQHSGLPPERLELEITETVLLEDDEANLAILRELRRLGVRVVLDDFGTGYSALGYLRRFPFDKIKIDRSFISDIPGRDESNAIVGAIIELGRSLGMAVVAEGVEHAEQLNRLRDEGCDEVQGHYFSRPVPACDVPATLGKLRALQLATG